MKKLLLIFFASVVTFLAFGQDPEIRLFDISHANKIADFPGSAYGKIGKFNGQYSTLNTYPTAFGYEREDVNNSLWNKIELPDTNLINQQSFFINGHWISIKYDTRSVVDANSNGFYTIELNFYEYDFKNKELIWKSKLENTLTKNLNCISLHYEVMQKGEELFISFIKDCSPNNHFVTTDGLVWNSISSTSKYQSNNIETNGEFISLDKNERIAFLSDSKNFDTYKSIQLPDSIDFNTIAAVIDFQDTVNLFLRNREQIFRTVDEGRSWFIEKSPFELNFSTKIKYHQGAFYILEDRKEPLRSFFPTFGYVSILPDSLLFDTYPSNPSAGGFYFFEGNEIMLDIGAGGLFRSFDSGETWERYVDGFPRVGLYGFKKYKNSFYSTGGHWTSNDGSIWNKSNLPPGNSTGAFFPFEREVYFSKSVDDSLRIYKSGDVTNWTLCGSPHRGTILGEVFHSESSLTFFIGNWRLVKTDLNCGNSMEFPKNVIEYFHDNRFITKGDTLLSTKAIFGEPHLLLRTFDFGQTWDTLSYSPQSSDQFFLIKNKIIRTDYTSGSISISEDWGQTWEKTISMLPSSDRYKVIEKRNHQLVCRVKSVDSDEPIFLFSEDLGKHWVGLEGNIIDIGFLQDSMILLNKPDGIYTMDGREIIDFSGIPISDSRNISLDESIQIYPNPFTNQLTIQNQNQNQNQNKTLKPSQLILLNQIGQTVLVKSLKNRLPEEIIQFETSRLSKGMYFINLKLEDGKNVMKKVIKQ